MPSSHLILWCPLLLLPPIPPSIRVFSNESTLCMRWPKYWSFSFHIIPSKEIPGLISFRMDCLDLLSVQGTLKSLLQHHSSKASILWRSAFFTVQLSHLGEAYSSKVCDNFRSVKCTLSYFREVIYGTDRVGKAHIPNTKYIHVYTHTYTHTRLLNIQNDRSILFKSMRRNILIY